MKSHAQVVVIGGGVVGASVELASETSSAIGDFFKSIAATLAGNPDVVTYFVYAVTAYGAYAVYRKYFSKGTRP